MFVHLLTLGLSRLNCAFSPRLSNHVNAKVTQSAVAFGQDEESSRSKVVGRFCSLYIVLGIVCGYR